MNSPFDPHQLLHLPLAVGMAWLVIVSEWVLGAIRYSKDAAKSLDRGSLPLIRAVMSVAIWGSGVATVFVPAANFSQVAQLAPFAIAWFVLGALLRWYSIFYLGRYFTVNVAIAADHRVIDSGPYHLIRHPSYTGALMMWSAVGVCYGNWVGLLLLVLPTFAVFLWRIHVEEGALTAALGDAYTNYKARTRRLIPFVY
jgi:protein-S-isoprenylcysteine O-methyltransferase